MGNQLFVIFAILDVSCAVNLCINHSFFLHLYLIKANDETNTVVPFFGQSNASIAHQIMSKLKG